jgi:hypothetical protein
MPFVPDTNARGDDITKEMDATKTKAAEAGYKDQDSWLKAIRSEDTMNDAPFGDRPERLAEQVRSAAIAAYAKKHSMGEDGASAVFSRVSKLGDGSFSGGDAEDKMLYGRWKDPKNYDTKVPRPETVSAWGYGSADTHTMKQAGYDKPVPKKRAQD